MFLMSVRKITVMISDKIHYKFTSKHVGCYSDRRKYTWKWIRITFWKNFNTYRIIFESQKIISQEFKKSWEPKKWKFGNKMMNEIKKNFFVTHMIYNKQGHIKEYFHILPPLLRKLVRKSEKLSIHRNDRITYL